jgi:hypothetical protein
MIGPLRLERSVCWHLQGGLSTGQEILYGADLETLGINRLSMEQRLALIHAILKRLPVVMSIVSYLAVLHGEFAVAALKPK